MIGKWVKENILKLNGFYGEYLNNKPILLETLV